MRILLMGTAALGFSGLIATAQADPLPFQDGRYLNENSLCSLTDDELVARVGDDIYTTLIEIDGSTLNEGYGAYCEVGKVTRNGNAVDFEASCDVEGDTNIVRFSYTFISPTSFQVGGSVYTLCR